MPLAVKLAHLIPVVDESRLRLCTSRSAHWVLLECRCLSDANCLHGKSEAWRHRYAVDD